MFDECVRVCRQRRLRPGRIHQWPVPGPDNPQWVLNLPTKDHWREPSRLEYVRDGLIALAALIQRDDIGSVALPALGCGLGRLRWQDVRLLIETNLKHLDNVHVTVLAPSKPSTITRKTTKPERRKTVTP